MNKTKVVVAYVPVIHKGYVEFFLRHRDNSSAFVFGEEVIGFVDRELDYLRKEIRALSPEQAKLSLCGLGVSKEIRILDLLECGLIASSHLEVVLPDDDVSRVLVEYYFKDNPVIYDNVFLRWDRKNVNAEGELVSDRIISVNAFDQEMMKQAIVEAERSSDWWRRIGALVATPDGRPLFSACNHHLPTPYTPYIDGDPRNTAKRGEGLDRYTSIHAEASVIAQAAGSDVSLCGAYLYTTTFPCPPCAKLIADAGLARLYYAEGYAVLDGADCLHRRSVEIVKVDLSLAP